jgi:hypothetical protein
MNHFYVPDLTFIPSISHFFSTYKPLAPRSPTDRTEYSTGRVKYTEEQLVRQTQHRQRILKILSSTTTSLQHNQHYHEENL